MKRVAIPDIPRWFFKPLPNRPWVAYLGEGGNKLLHLDSGLVLPVPGPRDPVPTPDGRFISVPGISLFATADLMDDAHRATVPALEARLHGEYQSPGILSETPERVVYRFIADDSGPVVRDFALTLHDDAPARIEALGVKRRLCRGMHLQLPMIAPGGRELGAYDVDGGTTRILRINDDDTCEVLTDLGIATGKLSFSFDERYVAFHLAHREKFSIKASQVPADRYAHNVFVVDRETARIARVTHNTASNAYYPAFRADGTLVYLFKPYDESGGRFNFVVADPAQISTWVPLAWVVGKCRSGDESCAETLALGSLRAHVCSRNGPKTSPATAALYTLSLRPESCRFLVRGHWRQHRESVSATLRFVPGSQGLASVDPEALARRCPVGLGLSTP